MQIRHKVLEMLASFDTAMMVTHAGSGPLDCRPMHVAEVEVERGGPIWFITSAESRKAMEIARAGRTLLTFQDSSRWLAVWGHSRMVTDANHLARLWKEPYRLWFPDGPDDPTLQLIAVVPHSAEFWDETNTAKVQYVFDPAATSVSRHAAAVSDESHGRTNL